MKKLSIELIKSIADDLECGMICYIHRETLEQISLPDFEALGGDAEGWEEDIEKIENNGKDYLQIEKLESRESFYIMESFVENLHDSVPAKKYLSIALANRKPFAGFNAIIHNEDDLRVEWFAHRTKCMLEYVQECLKADELNNK
jgi:Uncharacterised protein family (UPF0158)